MTACQHHAAAEGYSTGHRTVQDMRVAITLLNIMCNRMQGSITQSSNSGHLFIRSTRMPIAMACHSSIWTTAHADPITQRGFLNTVQMGQHSTCTERWAVCACHQAVSKLNIPCHH